jgi:hypothetical protein
MEDGLGGHLEKRHLQVDTPPSRISSFLFFGYITCKQCCGSGMFIPDPIFSIPDPRSRVDKIPDLGSGSASKKFKYF